MAYVLRRLALLVLILLVVSFFTYFLINLLPGDPTIAILGPSATPHANPSSCATSSGSETPSPATWAALT